MAKGNFETEVRFFFPQNKLHDLHNKIEEVGGEFSGRFYELTVMYDNPNPEFSFYPKEIDGRLRFRTSIHSPIKGQETKGDVKGDSSKITWKRRLPREDDSQIHREEEIEAAIDYKDYKNMEEIFQGILKCKRMSSYERYRSNYSIEGLQITLDEFPYGIMLEVELEDGSEDDLRKLVDDLGMNMSDAYHLSCDDKYVDLCEEAKIKPKDDILFEDEEMPLVS